jgi:hypothetical protein
MYSFVRVVFSTHVGIEVALLLLCPLSTFTFCFVASFNDIIIPYLFLSTGPRHLAWHEQNLFIFSSLILSAYHLVIYCPLPSIWDSQATDTYVKFLGNFFVGGAKRGETKRGVTKRAERGDRRNLGMRSKWQSSRRSTIGAVNFEFIHTHRHD